MLKKVPVLYQKRKKLYKSSSLRNNTNNLKRNVTIHYLDKFQLLYL